MAKNDPQSGSREAAERAMDLLWGVRGEPGRGPKRGLSVEKMVEAAVGLADEEGLEALSMRRVADRLGVGAMSLYTYVPGKTELVELMVDAVLGEAALPDGTAGWRAGLDVFARESWEIAHRHPWMLQVSSGRGLMGPNQAAMLDAVLGVVSGIGLSEQEMVYVYLVVQGYVRGTAKTSIEAARLEQDSGITDEQWWSLYGPLVYKYTDPKRYPTLTGISWEWAFGEEDDPFGFGLRRVLDGVEALVRSRSEMLDKR
jgi:AcrR family transcriptional regulator